MCTDEDCHQDVTIAIAGVSTNGHHSAGPEMVEYHHHVSNVRRWVDADTQPVAVLPQDLSQTWISILATMSLR